MDVGSTEAKAPPFKEMGGGGSGDDWRIHLYNQERMLVSQEQITNVLQRLLDQQQVLGDLNAKLNGHLDMLNHTLRESTETTRGMVRNLIKVPIILVLIGICSIAFYLKYISENAWMLIMAVAFFPYVGESITAVFKLVRGQHNNSGGAAK